MGSRVAPGRTQSIDRILESHLKDYTNAMFGLKVKPIHLSMSAIDAAAIMHDKHAKRVLELTLTKLAQLGIVSGFDIPGLDGAPMDKNAVTVQITPFEVTGKVHDGALAIADTTQVRHDWMGLFLAKSIEASIEGESRPTQRQLDALQGIYMRLRGGQPLAQRMNARVVQVFKFALKKLKAMASGTVEVLDDIYQGYESPGLLAADSAAYLEAYETALNSTNWTA
ncbi:MAG: hypothetical protein HQL11_03985 [Candidatus Omnitrophica bacterium]|nr:hypothetical protein [Candidatus Omnitrophota bacterium]